MSWHDEVGPDGLPPKSSANEPEYPNLGMIEQQTSSRPVCGVHI